MPRANRYILPGYAYHLTHRCHNRSFLLRFAKDRTAYRQRLRQAVGAFSTSVLTYCITSNHVHLLVTADAPESVSGLMQAGPLRDQFDVRRREIRIGVHGQASQRPGSGADQQHECQGEFRCNQKATQLIAMYAIAALTAALLERSAEICHCRAHRRLCASHGAVPLFRRAHGGPVRPSPCGRP